MDLNWKRIKKSNIYEALYISDSSDSDNDKKKIHLCEECKRKNFSRKSYRNNYIFNNNIDINNKINIIDNNMKKLYIDNKTNDNSLNPSKKPRNFGCGIYE